MTQIAIQLQPPHVGQQRILTEARRFNVACMGRRFGKTHLSISLLIQPALAGYPTAFFLPNYQMMTEVWRATKQVLRPVIARSSASEHRLELITGGVIDMWSLQNADSIRGRKYKRVIIDEAAMVPNLGDAWQQVIRPTLTDYAGDAFFMSTPKGRNFFWECYQRGQDPLQSEWMSWQMPTTANPFINPAEVDAARRELPELVFAQEYLAAPMLDTGSLFRQVRAAARAEAHSDADGRPRPVTGHSYVFGVDWGRQNDYTVISVVDTTTLAQVYLDRFQQVDYALQRGRLASLAAIFQPTVIVAEANNMGGPLVEDLRQSLPVQPFWTSNSTKKEIIDDLALGFEQGTFTILNDAIQVGELLQFEQTRLPSGLWRYAAAGGGHDDCVIALALSKYAAAHGAAQLVDNPFYRDPLRAAPSIWERW